MGATYTRQSSSAIVDGGVIEASDINAEFNQVLAAFAVTSGHTHDGTAAEGGPITKLLGTAITIGDATAGTDIALTFDGESNDGVLTWMEDEDYFKFSDDILMNSTERLNFGDTGTYIFQSTDGQLDIIADTEVQIAATTIDINGAVDISGALTLAGTTLAETISDTVGAMVTSNTETGITVTYEDSDNTLDFALGAAQTTITSLLATDIKIGEDNETKIDFEIANEIHLYAANAEQVYVADGIFGPQTDSDVDLGTTGVRWKDAFIDSITTTGDITIGGDLTVSGDDITMGTNTAGNLLVADGTNFNSIAVSSLSEIGTAASDDVFIAIDTSGGGLKKITRSSIIAGTGSSGDLANVVEDTSPQLGGNLDMNGADIVTTSNATIDLAPNGTGTVVVRGNTNSGAIVFNCESNSHGQTVIAQPHSASVTNTMLLPAGASSTLVSLVSTDTLTNKTLTLPKIAEIVSLSSGDITLDAEVDINLEAAADVNVPVNIGLTFGDDGEKIEGNGTDLTINSSNDLHLTATTDINIPVNVGLTFGDDGEKIEGDGTNLTISSSGTTTIDSTGDIILDGSNQAFFKAAGTSYLGILNNASHAQLRNYNSDKDISFIGNDGGVSTTALTLDMSEAGAATFNDKIIATELDISGAIDVDGTANLDVVDIDGAVDMATTLQVDGAITTGGLLTAGAKIDLNGTELILDADADTSITADTDDTIDIRIAGADDFQFTANTFTIPSGSTVAIAAGGAITNAGTMSPDITSTGKALVFGF